MTVPFDDQKEVRIVALLFFWLAGVDHLNMGRTHISSSSKNIATLVHHYHPFLTCSTVKLRCKGSRIHVSQLFTRTKKKSFPHFLASLLDVIGNHA